jgi:sarcosine oxidase
LQSPGHGVPLSHIRMKTFDAAVFGLGALGSAAAFQLARRGASVLAFDRYAPPHSLGSTHGGSRITRCAIGEGEVYTPFALRSHALWREIEQETAATLFSALGVLIISGPAKTGFNHVEEFFANTLAAARSYGIAHEILDAEAIRRRFPQFRIRDDESGYFEPGAGFLRPEVCVGAQLDLARGHGAEIHLNERVTAFLPRAGDVLITTDEDTYAAQRLVIAAGPWLPELLDAPLSGHFRVFRQVQFWFAPADDSFRADRCPVFIWELSGRRHGIYGFPDFDGGGVKVASEQYDATTTAAGVKRDVDPAECAFMHDHFVAPHLAGVTARCIRTATCLYTVTDGARFVVDRHPDSERIILASCCSGHGFKHSAALGEAIAEEIVDGKSRLDLSPFALANLPQAPAA